MVACHEKSVPPSEEEGRTAESRPAAAKPEALRPTVPLQIALQGLMAASEGTVHDRNLLWAWMIDTRDPNGKNRPPCVAPGPVLLADYPLHLPVLYVQEGSIYEDNSPLGERLIDLTRQDVVVDTGGTGDGTRDLTALISGPELKSLGLDPGQALQEVRDPLVDPEILDESLVARVRIVGAYDARAQANTCPGMDRTFSMAHQVDCDPTGDGVPFGEEILLKQEDVAEVVVRLTDHNAGGGRSRTLTIRPTGSRLTIAVRNVMQQHSGGKVDLNTVPIEYCESTSHHFDTYRWFYSLSDVKTASCLVPCQAAKARGGFKCPIPDPGGP